MITIVGAIIVNNLSQEIRDSKYFSIMSDEAADTSNKENLSVVIRFRPKKFGSRSTTSSMAALNRNLHARLLRHRKANF